MFISFLMFLQITFFMEVHQLIRRSEAFKIFLSNKLSISRLHILGPPWWLSSKESTCQCRSLGSILGSGRSPGKENGSPLQYSCLGNPMDRGAWRATVHGAAESVTHMHAHAPNLMLISSAMLSEGTWVRDKGL